MFLLIIPNVHLIINYILILIINMIKLINLIILKTEIAYYKHYKFYYICNYIAISCLPISKILLLVSNLYLMHLTFGIF